MTQRRVPAALIPSILDLAIRNRTPLESIFANAKLDPAVIGAGSSNLSVEQAVQLFDAAIAVSGDNTFGIRVGETVQYHNFELVGQAVATSGTLRGALQVVFNFKDMIAPFADFSLEIDRDVAVLGYSLDPFVIRQYRQVYHDVVATAACTVARALTGADLGLHEVHFVHDSPAHLAEYQRVFGVPVRFGAPRNEIRFAANKLDLPLLTAYPEYHQRVHALATERLRHLESDLGFARKVQNFIERHMATGQANLDDVAAHFNMTPRTLQRRLQMENVSFAELRDRCRHERALRDLADRRVDIDALAERLGFSDTSNFYHAFKRWQGVSPGAYRRSLEPVTSDDEVSTA